MKARMLPFAGVQFGIGRGFGVAANAQQRPEGVERVEPPIEAEGKLMPKGWKPPDIAGIIEAASKARPRST